MADYTLLNNDRPPVFCPGCSHDNALKILDQAFVNMGLKGGDICMVSDIGCSGLFDTFYHTHALHGAHGRALTYATGLKLCRPELNVVVTMGDGGLGIGGAHVLSACRRNLDLTLLVLNNFNFGMTGGQCSVTSPQDAVLGSGFLNQLDRPLNLNQVAGAAGAPFVATVSAYDKGVSDVVRQAIEYKGFSIVEVQGLCPGRFTKRNKLSPKKISERITDLPHGEIEANRRPEYGQAYRETAARLTPAPRPASIEKSLEPPQAEKQSVVLLGSAGQRAITAGELVGLAGMHGGLYVTQKNEYNITVLRGPSIAELNLSPEPIGYTGIEVPDAVLAVAPEGVERRAAVFGKLTKDTLVIKAKQVELPPTQANIVEVDFKALGLKQVDWSLASLAALAKQRRAITPEMLEAALKTRFKGKVLEASLQVINKVLAA
jgi:2-oxoglutarate ferredoxin oxidoreductase subunit beta